MYLLGENALMERQTSNLKAVAYRYCIILIAPLLVSMMFTDSVQAEPVSLSEFSKSPNQFVVSNVAESYDFFGLAQFYNNVLCLKLVKTSHVDECDEGELRLSHDEQLLLLGRYNYLYIQGVNTTLEISHGDKPYEILSFTADVDTQLFLGEKKDLWQISDELNRYRYAYLWAPFAYLALLVEYVLKAIQKITGISWGGAIILLAILFKIMMFPVNRMTANQQKKVNYIQSELQPKLAAIKKNYKGEEAHNRLVAAHREHGVSLFYTMKPLLTLLIQIPFLIAIFNVLGELSSLRGQSFLWIHDLAYPDSIMHLGFTIPFMGGTINALPFLMTLVTIFSTMMHKDGTMLDSAMKKQRLKLYAMAFGFFVLFYPFPAAMVLYWTIANLLHFLQQELFKSE